MVSHRRLLPLHSFHQIVCNSQIYDECYKVNQQSLGCVPEGSSRRIQLYFNLYVFEFPILLFTVSKACILILVACILILIKVC